MVFEVCLGFNFPTCTARCSQCLFEQCEIRPSHASYKYTEGAPELPKALKKEKWQRGCMVKGRNEPVTIPQVAQVIAEVKGVPVEEVCEA